MKITVVGTGYVGLIAGVGFADFGNDVICVENDQKKLKQLQAGVCPIYEPGVNELLARNCANGRLTFTDDIQKAVEFAELIFITVGTPEDAEGNADLRYVFQIAKEIGSYINGYKVVVDKSTVPVGTSRKVAKIIQEEIEKRGLEIEFDVASNPEFLREGKSISDFTNPDRIVLGVPSKRAEEMLVQLYQVFSRSNKPIIVTNPETAEMIKYAANAFLATKITFINEISNLCEKVGANVLEVANALGKDGRISPKFLHPGPGYGGSCFPKDTKAIAKTGEEYGVKMSIIESVITANQRQKELAAQKIREKLPQGGTIGCLGLAFKPDTDDIRESPAIEIIRILAQDPKFRFQAYDPQAMENAKRALSDIPEDQIVWCKTMKEAIEGCDALAIITEWTEFRSLDFQRLQGQMKGNILFDLRNIYPRKEVEGHGFVYVGMGC